MTEQANATAEAPAAMAPQPHCPTCRCRVTFTTGAQDIAVQLDDALAALKTAARTLAQVRLEIALARGEGQVPMP